MKTYNPTEAKTLMNRYGKERKPFLFIISYDLTKTHIIPLDEIDPAEILFDFNGKTNCEIASCPAESPQWKRSPITYEAYKGRFNNVMRHLKRGDSFLTNLTIATPVETNLSLKEIFLSSHALYRLWVKDSFCSLSPEIFVRIVDGEIASYPMKGTIDAQIENAEQKILEDEKESAEHATIVDLIRNDLSMNANEVSVKRYRYIDLLQTNDRDLLQVSSEITGRLHFEYRSKLGNILYSMLPAGSICGAPKTKTLEIIRESEESNRGYYTGIAGIFDGENLDSCVLIRFVEQLPDGKMQFRSGGGITAKSQAKDEYEEAIRKVYLPLIRKG